MSSAQSPPKSNIITGLHAKFYDLRQPIWRYIRRGHLQNISLKSGQHLLDVGCGTGNTLLALHEKYGNAVRFSGVEPSAEMLDQAKVRFEQTKSIELQIGTAEKLPYVDNSFDYVTCSLVFHHLPMALKQKALEEIHRVLKPGGTIVLSDWEKPTAFLGKLIGFLWRNHAYVRENLQGPLEQSLKDASFKEVRVTSIQAGIVRHFVGKK